MYRARLTRHPFLLFGLPFIAIMVAGSFILTPATALRYERYDRKVKQVSREEAMDLGLRGVDGGEGIRRNPRRRIVGDEREEYYVSPECFVSPTIRLHVCELTELGATEAHGQGSGQLGAEASAEIQGRTGRKIVNNEE